MFLLVGLGWGWDWGWVLELERKYGGGRVGVGVGVSLLLFLKVRAQLFWRGSLGWLLDVHRVLWLSAVSVLAGSEKS